MDDPDHSEGEDRLLLLGCCVQARCATAPEEEMGAELGMPYQNLINLILRDCAIAETPTRHSMAG